LIQLTSPVINNLLLFLVSRTVDFPQFSYLWLFNTSAEVPGLTLNRLRKRSFKLFDVYREGK